MYGEVLEKGLAPIPDRGWARLPAGLAGMAPGPKLGVVLGGIDPDRLSGADRVEFLQATARMVAHYQARYYAAIDSIHRYETDNPDNLEVFSTPEISDLAASEIQVALHLTPRAATYQLFLAEDLCQRLPQVHQALEHGLIDLARARVIIDETAHLTPAEAQTTTDQAIATAQTLTTGQLRVRLARLCMSVDPDSATKRYTQALEDRKIVSDRNPSGTGNIFATDLPAQLTTAAMRRINHLAKGLRSKDDPRTMDQIRADVYLDLLLGTEQATSKTGSVDIRVDLTTLIELDDKPGDLAGYGPLVADITRQVVEDHKQTPHTVTVTDYGEIIWTGTTRKRRANTAQQRQIRAQNPTCVFPGCRTPATDCDLDHQQPWSAGGPTTNTNLAPLCRRDHQRKHNGWRVSTTADGRVWTSPLGHTYRVTGADPP
jgi:hypothetical protein